MEPLLLLGRAVLVFLLLGAVLWAVRRSDGLKRLRRPEAPLEVLGSARLGKGASVALVRIGDSDYALGVTDQAVSLLTEAELSELGHRGDRGDQGDQGDRGGHREPAGPDDGSRPGFAAALQTQVALLVRRQRSGGSDDAALAPAAVPALPADLPAVPALPADLPAVPAPPAAVPTATARPAAPALGRAACESGPRTGARRRPPARTEPPTEPPTARPVRPLPPAAPAGSPTGRAARPTGARVTSLTGTRSGPGAVAGPGTGPGTGRRRPRANSAATPARPLPSSEHTEHPAA